MAKQKWALQELNTLDEAAFIQALSGLFEGLPWIVAQAWSLRPFASRAQLYQELCTLMYRAPQAQKLELLRAHPDLVGRAALAGTLSPASSSEQAAAGLDQLTAEEIATFQRFNAEYRQKFAFPFVVCARENKKESILTGFAMRLPHTREEEIAIALAEVAKICALRLQDLVDDSTLSQSEAR